MNVTQILEKYFGESGKEAGQKWDNLDGKSKGLIGALAAVDTVMKGVALSALAKTPANKLRGPKFVWGIVIPSINTLGWAAFYLFGRKK